MIRWFLSLSFALSVIAVVVFIAMVFLTAPVDLGGGLK